jgi:hypothetical protein
VSGSNNPTALDKEIEKTFSQHWSIYRIAMHEKGGLELAAEMDWKYSTRQLLRFLELLDVHDSLDKQARDRSVANKNKPK